HRARQLEVVVVRIRERGDPVPRRLIEGIWLLDDDGARGLHPLEFALHVGRLDVPDEPARLRVLAVDLAVRPDRDRARPELPAAVAALVQRGLAEDLAVVV